MRTDHGTSITRKMSFEFSRIWIRATVGRCMMDMGMRSPMRCVRTRKPRYGNRFRCGCLACRADGRISLLVLRQGSLSVALAGCLEKFHHWRRTWCDYSHACLRNRTEMEIVERETGQRNVVYLTHSAPWTTLLLAHCVHLDDERFRCCRVLVLTSHIAHLQPQLGSVSRA